MGKTFRRDKDNRPKKGGKVFNKDKPQKKDKHPFVWDKQPPVLPEDIQRGDYT